jgi:hypothetical protein
VRSIGMLAPPAHTGTHLTSYLPVLADYPTMPKGSPRGVPGTVKIGFN